MKTSSRRRLIAFGLVATVCTALALRRPIYQGIGMTLVAAGDYGQALDYFDYAEDRCGAGAAYLGMGNERRAIESLAGHDDWRAALATVARHAPDLLPEFMARADVLARIRAAPLAGQVWALELLLEHTDVDGPDTPPATNARVLRWVAAVLPHTDRAEEYTATLERLDLAAASR